MARIGYTPYATQETIGIPQELDALLIRPIGRGSLEETVFRMNLLHRLQRLGMYILNPPQAIENCADKYHILSILEEGGLPVPRTAVTEDETEALKAFHELGQDVIVKPIFGSRGLGSTRVTDPENAHLTFQTIRFNHGVIYLQEFIPHHHTDLRAFVVGDRVVAAMKRVSDSWKTNYSQGGRPVSTQLDPTRKDMAIQAAHLIQCKIAGVDMVDSPTGPILIEVNSQPGWKGLQSVTNHNIAETIIDFLLSELKT